ncbi:hypothetical protein GPUN_2857 [Glaciecola punicea ACAM 611]|uniref:Glycosyltransferase 2-like domain-containing protein n=1 Tax=Glaciecola punicea ACAM 611 TaxID=1121923 RepID=H5TF44_9ALTE|nr:glycosyltransferase [Glaciecola punicea]GAB56971.1 hypothetical protein GPUN_2857 [Glaciecola punicea ACAM 611]
MIKDASLTVENGHHKSNKPLISVYMPTRNRARLIDKAIYSVLNQAWKNLELIIVNDCSTDNTRETLEKWQKQDPRIKVLHNTKLMGACASRNIAIKASHGKFITGIDDDDEFVGERLCALFAAYDERYSFICAGYLWFDDKKDRKVLCKDEIVSLEQQLSYNKVSNQIFIERHRILAIGGFDENFVSLQDYDCFTRLIHRFGPAYRLGIPLMRIYAFKTEDRISNSQKYWMGFQQFMDKHGKLMSPMQCRNISVMMAIQKNEKITLLDILSTYKAGRVPRKVKHYLTCILGEMQWLKS